MNVLIGSCIKEDPQILEEFLDSIDELEDDSSLVIDYMLIDDGNDADSCQLLETFARKHTNTILLKSESVDTQKRKDNITHYWDDDKIWHVAELKNKILHYAQSNDYDFVFLLDSDIILHPNTLIKLIQSEKDIISEIFWTKWRPNTTELPQVWLSDQYNFFYKDITNEAIDNNEVNKRTANFLEMLKKPGVYKVGGLGACTLISKRALDSGVSFKEIYNLSFWGEDRHFCVRAAALGFELYVDTHYPALHLYRKEDLMKVKDYKDGCKNGKQSQTTLSLCLITKDEEKNIARCINSVKDIVDEIIVVDTGSKDRTVEIAKELGAKVIETQWEDDFSKARNVALDNATSDWILFLDADEEIAKDDVGKIKEVIENNEIDAYLLKIVNFAGSSISSGLSEIHFNIRLFRNKKSIRYKYPVHEQVIDLDSGNNPLPKITEIKILHYGYLSEIVKDRKKTERYTRMISKYLERHPDDTFQQFNLAVEYYNDGQYEKALKLLNKVSKSITVGLNYSTRLLRYMIECYMELKRYDEAYKYIKGAQDLYKDMPDFVFLEGELYYHQRRYEKAIKTFEKCIEIGEYSNGIYVSMGGTGSYRAYLTMAVCHEQLGDLSSAVEEYIEALKTNRDFSLAFNRLMNLLIKNEKPEGIEQFFNRYVDYTLPNNQLIMCKLYIENGMPDVAEKYLKNIKYDIPGLNIFRGLIEIRRNNYEKAINYLNLADDENIKNDALYYKVICNLLLERYEEARDIINNMNLSPMRLVLGSVVEGRPYKNIEKIRDQIFTLLRYLCNVCAFDLFNKIVSLYEVEFYREDYENLGVLFKENGFYEPSVNAFIKAAELNSSNSEVYRNLAEYCIENNMIEDAKNFALNAVALDEYNADNYRTLLKVSILVDDEFKSATEEIVKEKYPELMGYARV